MLLSVLKINGGKAMKNEGYSHLIGKVRVNNIELGYDCIVNYRMFNFVKALPSACSFLTKAITTVLRKTCLTHFATLLLLDS